MTENQLFRHFQLEKQTGILETKTTQTIDRVIHDCIIDDDWLAICAPIGTGKTHVVKNAINKVQAMWNQERSRQQVKLIGLVSTSEKGLRIGDILDEIIEELGQDTIKENPTRSVRARVKQVKRIMSMARAHHNWKVVLVIDRAHFLHIETIKAIKGLREIDFANFDKFFSVILIGEPSLEMKILSDREVRIRCGIQMFSYKSFEIEEIIRFHAGSAIDPSIIRDLATRYQTPGEFLSDWRQAMENAMKLDCSIVTIENFPARLVTPVAPRKRGRPSVNPTALADIEGKYGQHQERAAV